MFIIISVKQQSRTRQPKVFVFVFFIPPLTSMKALVKQNSTVSFHRSLIHFTHSLFRLLSRSFMHTPNLLIHSPIRPLSFIFFIHSRSRSLIHSSTHAPSHSFIHPLTHPITHSFTHSRTQSPIHSPTHSLFYSHTHSVKEASTEPQQIFVFIIIKNKSYYYYWCNLLTHDVVMIIVRSV